MHAYLFLSELWSKRYALKGESYNSNKYKKESLSNLDSSPFANFGTRLLRIAIDKYST